MTTDTLSDFDREYLQTWTEPDPQQRRAHIERLWSPEGRMVVSSIGVTLRGIDEIAAHVGRVHDENIAGKGLTFRYDQHVEADDALLLRWSMLLPGGAVAARGADVLVRDEAGLVQSAHMFMGVD